MIKIILEKILALIGLVFLLVLLFFWVDGIHPYEIWKTVQNISKNSTFDQENVQKEPNQLSVIPNSVSNETDNQ